MQNLSAGLDLKYGLTSNITLDATVNPDFGQVEADPAVVNLTAFETFFDERRPFFIERADLFQFSEGTPETFFYSRRIGKSPSLSSVGAAPYVDQPEAATILGAAKATGRTSKGWSVGVLEAVTAKEWAQLADASGNPLPETGVEPLTNYAVGRLRKEYGGGLNYVGGMFTAVNRNLDEEEFDVLRSAAYAGGVDFRHRFGKNTVADQRMALGVVRGRQQRRNARDPDRVHPLLPAAGPGLPRLRSERDVVVGIRGGSGPAAGRWRLDRPHRRCRDLARLRAQRRRVPDRCRPGATSSGGITRRWVQPGKVFRNFSTTLRLEQHLNYGGTNLRRTAIAQCERQLQQPVERLRVHAVCGIRRRMTG